MYQSLEKRFLFLSVLFSFLVHVCCVAFLQSYSLWFSSQRPVTSSSLLPQTPRHEILHLSIHPNQVTTAPSPPLPVVENQSTKLEQANRIAHQPPAAQEPEFHFSSPEVLLSSISPQKMISFSFPLVEPTLSFSKQLTTPTLSLPTTQFLPQTEASPVTSISTPSLSSIPFSNSSFAKAELPPLSIENVSMQATPSVHAPQLPSIPTLAELDTVNLSEAFEAELLFFPREDAPGHLFALTLIPRKDLDLPKLRQHIIFLLDRSNCIQSERLHASKNAVRKAIEELQEGSQFNVFVFDSKMEKLFSTSKNPSPEIFAEADQFLDRIQLGSFFSTTDLFKPLLHTIPGKVEEDELYTTILLTDGESLGKTQTQKLLLHDWTHRNQGKSALYTLAMETDSHLGSLDAMSALNKGKLFYASTKRGLKRKLLKLMKTIRSPVAKGISIKAIPSHEGIQVDLYSTPQNSPPLYLNQPYVILGTTNSLDDFVLFFQGRMKDRWLHIKKTVSFVNAKKGGNSLKAEWALQQAYRHYEQYASDNNPQHLTEARLLLEPYQLQSAFE